MMHSSKFVLGRRIGQSDQTFTLPPTKKKWRSELRFEGCSEHRNCMPQICAANCTIEHGKSSKGLPWNTKPHKESSRPDRSTVDFSKLKRTPQKNTSSAPITNKSCSGRHRASWLRVSMDRLKQEGKKVVCLFSSPSSVSFERIAALHQHTLLPRLLASQLSLGGTGGLELVAYLLVLRDPHLPPQQGKVCKMFISNQNTRKAPKT